MICHFFNRKKLQNKINLKMVGFSGENGFFSTEKFMLKLMGKIVEKVKPLWYNIEV